MTHTIGLSSIHRRLKYVRDLIERGHDLHVHYRGEVLFKIVPVERPDDPMTVMRKKVAAKLGDLI
jgi:antitoxin (DNA-binding transcriptional repressor) of toxin-antitoxin stability system